MSKPFEVRAREVMREERCDWWEACAIMARRSAAARKERNSWRGQKPKDSTVAQARERMDARKDLQ